MDIKKFLEKAAEEDREAQVTDRDIEFLASIGVDYEKKREAAKNAPDSSYYLTKNTFNQRAFLISMACFVVAVIAVAMILYFCLKPKSPLQYFADNFVDVESDIQELNGDLQLFSIIADNDAYVVEINKTYDSVSGDNLFYSLSFISKRGVGLKLKLDIVVNSLFEHDEIPYLGELKEAQLSGYPVKYTEKSMAVSGTPFYSVSCKGEIQIGKQWIYITDYEETSLVQNPFLTTMQTIISFN